MQCLLLSARLQLVGEVRVLDVMEGTRPRGRRTTCVDVTLNYFLGALGGYEVLHPLGSIYKVQT